MAKFVKAPDQEEGLNRLTKPEIDFYSAAKRILKGNVT